jgi:hypothetical protein
MPALGQSRRFGPPPMTSGLTPEADTVTAGRHVSKVPNSEVIPLGTSVGVADRFDQDHLGRRARQGSLRYS